MALVLALAAAGCGAVGAVDDRREGPGPRLPVSPFAAARPGDWSWLRGGGAGVVIYRVESVDGDDVTVLETRFAGVLRTQQRARYSRRVPPSITDFFQSDEGARISQIRVADAEVEVGGKICRAKKLSFVEASTADGAEAASVATAWFAPEVPGCALAALERESGAIVAGRPATLRARSELQGYGRGDDVAWGEPPPPLVTAR
jgi:hypothetical protein